MNKNVNVFIAVLLCALLCGGVVWLRMASEEKLGWNIQDTYSASPAYSSGASYSDATFVGSSSGGVMSMTSARSLRTRMSASSYAGAYSGVATQPFTSNLSPLTSSAPAGDGLYTTSSQTFKSFGGGNNALVSMSGGSLVTTNNYAQASSAVSISSPIGYTSLARNMANPQEVLANGLSSEAVIASSMAMPTNGQLFGSYYTNDFSSSIDSYNPGSYGGIGYSSVGNRQNAVGNPGGNPYTSWLMWLEEYMSGQEGTAFDFDYDDVWNAYVQWYLDTYKVEYGSGTGPTPQITWEMWLQYFMSNGGSHDYNGKTYNFVPVGDFLSLLFLALLYFIFISLKSMKPLKVLNKE